MFNLILAFFMAFSCPSHSYPSNHGGGSQVTTLDDDNGGETGHIPPGKPVKP